MTEPVQPVEDAIKTCDHRETWTICRACFSATVAALQAEIQTWKDRAMGAEHNEGMALADVEALQADKERFRRACLLMTRNNKQLLSERDLANARARNLGDSAHDLETENTALRRVVDAITYAMESGCFRPVPGLGKAASTKWSALRNFHAAYAALTRPASPPEAR